MQIDKLAKSTDFSFETYYFDRARDAFKYSLSNTVYNNKKVILPAFVGFSIREGSGVFDPVSELRLKFDFYKVDKSLHVDLSHYEALIKEGDVQVVVLIHYFGHIDPNYSKLIEIARKYGCLIIEDGAHALYTDFIDGTCGRLGDASIFSLHKMLPLKKGGLLKVMRNSIQVPSECNIREVCLIQNFDLKVISDKRKENAEYLRIKLQSIDGISILWENSYYRETLQTFPIIIHKDNRDDIYQKLNEKGFGVVTLYHTLIDKIDKDKFPDSHFLAKHILNLPIHQDVTPNNIDELVVELIKLL